MSEVPLYPFSGERDVFDPKQVESHLRRIRLRSTRKQTVGSVSSEIRNGALGNK